MRAWIATVIFLLAVSLSVPPAHAQTADAPGCEAMMVLEWLNDPVTLHDIRGVAAAQIARADLASVNSAQFCDDAPAWARVSVSGQIYLIARSSMRTVSLDAVLGGAIVGGIVGGRVGGGSGAIARPRPPPTPSPNQDAGTGARPPTSATRGVGRRARTLTPALVELLGDQARTPRQGGSAVVLLAGPAARAQAQRNELLCQTMFQVFDQATPSEIAVGVRTDPDGGTQLLRPIYWPVVANSQNAPGAGGCTQRIANFDFPRGERLRNKFRLTNAGPYIAIERYEANQTETLVAVIDFTNARPNEIPSVVNDFRDGFSQRNDIWNPSLYTPDPSRSMVASIFGGATSGAVLPRLSQVTQHIACPLANLLDVCRN